jgi:predicted ABC-type ATPase
VFTPERQKVHFEILNKVLGGHSPKETPTFTVLGGGPASGKSTIDIQHPEIRGDNAMVNPDDIKAMLPEYNTSDPKSAAFTHEESSYLSQKILEEGIARKIGLTLDGTGNSSASKVRSKFMPARRAGYKIGAYYVTIPTEEAVKRSMERAKKSGRMVPPDVIRQTHQRVSATFPLIMNEFDFASLYDNSGPPGHALLVGSKRTGERFKVFDKPAWNRFLAKAGEM